MYNVCLLPKSVHAVYSYSLIYSFDQTYTDILKVQRSTFKGTTPEQGKKKIQF